MNRNILVGLFKVDVGSDIVVDYVDSLLLHSKYEFWLRMGALWSLFGCALLITLAIWTIPFFLFSQKRIAYAKSTAVQFYIGTKLLSILAIIPFYVVANAFYFRDRPDEVPFWSTLVPSLATVAIFMFIEFRVLTVSPLKNWLDAASERIRDWGDRRLRGNRYLVILIKIMTIEFALVVLIAAFIPFFGDDMIHQLVSFFLLASSSIVFRLLFFTDDSRLNDLQVLGMVTEMTASANRGASRPFYWAVIAILIAVNTYYFLVPSLTATNTVYVVLCVFAL